MSAVITTVFAHNQATEDIAKRCMAATMAGPCDTRIAAIDLATPSLEQWLIDNRWVIVKLEDGSPPRMTELLRVALDYVSTPHVWTIEMDATIHPDTWDAMGNAMAHCNHLAGIESSAVNHKGRTTEPTQGRMAQCDAMPEFPEVLECDSISFSCCLWDTVALRSVDWPHVPALVKADSVLCAQLRSRGWRFGLHPVAENTHIRRTSRKAYIDWRHLA